MCESEHIKQASGILQRILAEEPEFWPYGLSVDQFDGGLYLLSKQANSQDFLGFVGWQERDEDDRKIGYYAIGVLPEYRRQGLAKAAVQKILKEKAAGVDEVRALVMSHNGPSKALAMSIPGVNLTLVEKMTAIEKMAKVDFNKVKNIAAPIIGALTAHTTFDQMAAIDRPLSSTFRPDQWGDDKMRKLMAAINLVGGAASGALIANKKPTTGAHVFLGLPAKDLIMKGIGSLHKADLLSEATRKALEANRNSALPKSVLYGALGLGAGALGLAGYSSLQKARAAKAQAEAARGGRVKVTLPTKDPNDAETLLDIPIEEMNLSRALKARLGRDTRRRLLEETRKRTVVRKPKDPNQPTEKELEDIALQMEAEELDKAATAAPQAAIPTPPGPGNPALRMSQQQAAAKSIDTSTTANPQILKAQQDAANASMEAQNQVAQTQQQTQQQMMDQQQQFQQQLAKADEATQRANQENQVLKMQLEKAKVEADLVKAKSQAKEELSKMQSDNASSSGSSQNEKLNELIGNRLQRVQRNVTKSATAGPWNIELDTKRNPPKPWERDALTGLKSESSDLDPVTGKPTPPPLKVLRDDAAQTINDKGFEYYAQGRAAPIHLFRASYGGIGDMLYKHLLHPYLTTPPAPQSADLNALGELRRYGAQVMNQPRF